MCLSRLVNHGPLPFPMLRIRIETGRNALTAWPHGLTTFYNDQTDPLEAGTNSKRPLINLIGWFLCVEQDFFLHNFNMCETKLLIKAYRRLSMPAQISIFVPGSTWHQGRTRRFVGKLGNLTLDQTLTPMVDRR